MMPSAAILAGGRAQRFSGRDKGALLIEGHTIRERQMIELSSITSDVLIVGSPIDSGPRTGGIPVRVVADRVPDCGPLGGLHTALLEARCDLTIVVAGDMPYISAPLLRHLLALVGDADAVVPRTARGYHPLCAVYTRACVETIAQQLAEGRLKMTDLLTRLRVRTVVAEDLRVVGDADHLLANVNSPEAYRELLTLHDHQR